MGNPTPQPATPQWPTLTQPSIGNRWHGYPDGPHIGHDLHVSIQTSVLPFYPSVVAFLDGELEQHRGSMVTRVDFEIKVSEWLASRNQSGSERPDDQTPAQALPEALPKPDAAPGDWDSADWDAFSSSVTCVFGPALKHLPENSFTGTEGEMDALPPL